LYSASVEYEGDDPFGFLIGPTNVSVHEAVSWARRNAPVVLVRTPDGIHDAGRAPRGSLPLWPEVDEATDQDLRLSPSDPEHWEVEGHVGARGGDLAEVARSLSEAIRLDPRTSGCRHWMREWGLAVAFTICCPPETRYEVGSRILRDGWRAADISDDEDIRYSTSSVTVRPAGPLG